MQKKGAATLYIVVGLTIFLIIMTYVFTMTSNLEIDILSYFSKIQKQYDITNEKPDILEKLRSDADKVIIPVENSEI